MESEQIPRLHYLPDGQPVPGGWLPKPPLQRFILEGCDLFKEYEDEVQWVEGTSAVEAAGIAEALYGDLCPNWRFSQVYWLREDTGDEVHVYTVLPSDPRDWTADDFERVLTGLPGKPDSKPRKRVVR